LDLHRRQIERGCIRRADAKQVIKFRASPYPQKKAMFSDDSRQSAPKKLSIFVFDLTKNGT
jgi:hypothetical protein